MMSLTVRDYSERVYNLFCRTGCRYTYTEMHHSRKELQITRFVVCTTTCKVSWHIGTRSWQRPHVYIDWFSSVLMSKIVECMMEIGTCQTSSALLWGYVTVHTSTCTSYFLKYIFKIITTHFFHHASSKCCADRKKQSTSSVAKVRVVTTRVPKYSVATAMRSTT